VEPIKYKEKYGLYNLNPNITLFTDTSLKKMHHYLINNGAITETNRLC